MTTVRLDSDTRHAIDQLAHDRQQTRSDVIREAIDLFLEQAGANTERSAKDRLAPFIGTVESGNKQRSQRTGEGFRQILEQRRARRSR